MIAPLLFSASLLYHGKKFSFLTSPDDAYEAMAALKHRKVNGEYELLVEYELNSKYAGQGEVAPEVWTSLKNAHEDLEDPNEPVNLAVKYCLQKKVKQLCMALAVALQKDPKKVFPKKAVDELFPALFGVEKGTKKRKETDDEPPPVCDKDHIHKDRPENYQKVEWECYFKPNYTGPSVHLLGAKCRKCVDPIPYEGRNKPGQSNPVWVCRSIMQQMSESCIANGILCNFHYEELLIKASPGRGKGKRQRRCVDACVWHPGHS